MYYITFEANEWCHSHLCYMQLFQQAKILVEASSLPQKTKQRTGAGWKYCQCIYLVGADIFIYIFTISSTTKFI